MPNSPLLKFGTRVPRSQGDSSSTFPIAFVEIPLPDPDYAVSIVDVSSGTVENGESRGAEIPFTGETGTLVLSRNPVSGSVSTLPGATFTLANPDPSRSDWSRQQSLITPIRVLRVEEDSSGTWTPVISRGLFYKVITLDSSEGTSSWLRTPFVDGQTILLGYTTELDWRMISGSGRHTGTGSSGGGSLWKIASSSQYSSDSRRVTLTPSGLSGESRSSRILSIGGLKTLTGVELLTEPGISSQAPGDGLGTLGSLKLELFSAAISGSLVSDSRVRSGTVRSSASISGSSLNSGVTLAALQTAASDSGLTSSTSVRLSGSLFAPAEGFYTLRIQAQGKFRLYHWDLPVIDKMYGTENEGKLREGIYGVYLHAGWHDIALDWSPESTSASTIKFSAPGLTFCSGNTTRSSLLSIDVDLGTLTLKQSYVGGEDSDSLLASFASTSSTIPFRGYMESGRWRGLDLNPSAGRYYDSDDSTQAWVSSSCWIWATPAIACALTDSSGVPYTTGTRIWQSASDYGLSSTLRWGKVDATSVASGVSSSVPFGASSSFGGAVLGESQYSASGSVTGLTAFSDPRGDYASGFVLAHLSCASGLPELSDVRIHDLRIRGGGLSHEIDPSTLPVGALREQAASFYDLSSWEGGQSSPAGIALVEIPSSVLTGADGGPSWTAAEVDQLVRDTLPLGIDAKILFTD